MKPSLKYKSTFPITITFLIIFLIQLFGSSISLNVSLLLPTLVVYFWLGLSAIKHSEKFIIFTITVLLTLILGSLDVELTPFYLTMFLKRRFLFYALSFGIGFLLGRFNRSFKIALGIGILPFLVQTLLFSLFHLDPIILLYVAYISITITYFYLIKSLQILHFLFYLIPLILYFIYGLIFYKNPGTKEIIIVFSLFAIIFSEYLLIKFLKVRNSTER